MHKKGCHRSTHQRKRREMKLVLLFLLAARGGLKAKCVKETERGGGRRSWDSQEKEGGPGLGREWGALKSEV